jgi:hypothetical protein
MSRAFVTDKEDWVYCAKATKKEVIILQEIVAPEMRLRSSWAGYYFR